MTTADWEQKLKQIEDAEFAAGSFELSVGQFMRRARRPDMTFLVGRMRLAFQQRTGAPSRFGLIASEASRGTWIWWRDYEAHRQGLLSRVRTSQAIAVLTILLRDLEALRGREAA